MHPGLAALAPSRLLLTRRTADAVPLGAAGCITSRVHPGLATLAPSRLLLTGGAADAIRPLEFTDLCLAPMSGVKPTAAV